MLRPTWSADGQTIVFDSDYENPAPLFPSEGEGADLWAYDLPTGTFTRLTQDLNGSNSYSRFGHSTNRLVWVRYGQQAQQRFVQMVAEVIREVDGTTRLEDERSLYEFDEHEPVPVGEVVEYVIEIHPTSNVFQAGHRVRLDVFGAGHQASIRRGRRARES